MSEALCRWENMCGVVAVVENWDEIGRCPTAEGVIVVPSGRWTRGPVVVGSMLRKQLASVSLK